MYGVVGIRLCTWKSQVYGVLGMRLCIWIEAVYLERRQCIWNGGSVLGKMG
jgi:hypothetical protein